METKSDFRLTEEEIASFKKNGFLFPITLYEPEEIDLLWRQARTELLDRSNAAYSADSVAAVNGVTNIANYDRHLDNEFLANHICLPQIVDRVASLLGPDILCWRTEFFPKEPGDEGTDWHQADTFANASGSPQILWPANDESFVRGGTVTVWTALTDTTIRTACLQFIPGTHNHMNYDESKPMDYRPEYMNRTTKDGVNRGFYGYDYRQLQIDPNFVPDETKAIPVELKRGQCVMFLSTLMHASYPNNGGPRESRLGFASRYVPTRVRVYPDTEVVEEYGGSVPLDRYGAVVVSGEDRYGFNAIASSTLTGVPFVSRAPQRA